ncbi:MAG: autotransporter-associated beta strand repeat-containing protein, partial [Myxococcota bacterium]
GLGGAVFVRQGGQLTIVGGGVGTALANTSTAGLGADGGADGEASGGGLYLMDQVDLAAEVAAGETLTLASAIGGDGGITKTGAGELLLESAGNDYGGGTTVQEGRVVGSGDAIQGRFVLSASDATLELEEADMATGEVTAFISGAGKVEKDGLGTTILNPTGGTNNWLGGTEVLAGTLQASAGALPPTDAVTVQAGATLVLNEPGAADDATWAGGLVGDGAFLKTGPGTSRLTGSNSFTGTFTVEEGTLRGNVGSLPSATPIRIEDARLVFDQGSAGTFSGTLQSVAMGQGVLEKAGGGTLTFDTPHTTFTGDTVVSAGTLLLTESLGTVGSGAQASVNGGTLIVNGNGALFADTTVALGARLEGNASGAGDGLIGDLVLNGTLAPGSTVGTLRVDGNVTFGAASVYELEYDLTGPTADLLEVTGSAAIDGELAIRLLGAGRGGPVAIVTAAGGRTGCFDSIVNQPGFFTFSLDCDPGPGDPNAVILDIAFDDTARFSDFALTGNQTAVANALDPPPDPDDAPFTDPWDEARFELVKIPGRLPAVYDELGGEAHTAFTTARLANAQEVGRVISARLRQVGVAAWAARAPWTS